MKFHCDSDVYSALIRADIVISTTRDVPVSYLYRAADNPNMIAYMTERKVKDFEKDKSKGISPFVFPAKKEIQSYAIMAKPGRVIKKLLPKISGKKLTNFVLHFTPNIGKFEIWDNVTKAYKCERIGSCMTGNDMSFYSKNGIKILVFIVNSKIHGRAIYWPEIYFDKIKKSLPLIDRIYTVDGKDYPQFENYAFNNNCVLRLSYDRFLYKGKEFKCKIDFKLKTLNIDFWPYMDTFCWITEEGVLSNYISNNAVELDNTEGQNPFHDGEVYSEYEGCHLDEDSAVYSEYLSSFISEDSAVHVSDDYFPIDSDFISSCENCEEYILSEECITSYNGDDLCRDCFIEITAGKYEGEYASVNDDNIIETYDGKLCHIDDCVELENGKYALKNDLDLVEKENGFYYIERQTKKIKL